LTVIRGAAIVFAGALLIAAFVRPSRPARESDEGYQTHVYVTWDRFEVDRCVAAWLIKRFVDPLAQFELLPVGSELPQDGRIAFDAPKARYERTPGKPVSEAILSDTQLVDPAVSRIVQLVRATELAFWRLEADSQEGRLRNAIQLLWNPQLEPNERFRRVFSYLDALRDNGGVVP